MLKVASPGVEANRMTSEQGPGQDEAVDGADPFRGAQHDVAVRVTGALWLIGPLLMVPFLPFYPPTAQIGELGWVLVAVSTVISLTLGFMALTLRLRLSWNRLYGSSFNGIAQIALVQWLAGGGDAPYIQWLILPMIAVATQRAVGMVLPVLAFGTAAAFSPLLYSSIDVSATASGVVLISATSMIVSVVMAGVREHRAELRDEGELAASLARMDKLTGLPNRRSFEETLAETAESYREQGRPLAVLMCDVDNFKQINDTFGHPAGDGCLREIAAALNSAVRSPDQAYRWAGDEFAVILPDSDFQDAAVVGTRVAEAMELACHRPDGQAITIGIGSAELEDGMTAEQLLAAADAALLERKAARRRAEASPTGPDLSDPEVVAY
ncbi:MAG TPA: GGDEF domain-containing protein [Thermoleophilaceae bacterium]|nr:GGDEF domain-containing protein [Thermoleophilaceae bacterium]